jgi:carboxymethylenebutenolidase
MGYAGLQAETVTFRGHNGDTTEGYYARPLRPGPLPGVVVIHHMPGWDEWTTEVVRKFAHHGYTAVAPNLFVRFGPGSPDDVTARARPAGGASDAEVMGDVAGAMAYLRAQPEASGKIGVIGFCSGGRHTYLAACTVPGIDAAVDCWGGRVIVHDPAELTPKRPVAPITLTETLSCPLLGIFGNDDKNPSRQDVDRTEETLKRLGKAYEFHRYDGAGHGFFATDRPGSYCAEPAVDGWRRVFAFFEKYLTAGSAKSAAA